MAVPISDEAVEELWQRIKARHPNADEDLAEDVKKLGLTEEQLRELASPLSKTTTRLLDLPPDAELVRRVVEAGFLYGLVVGFELRGLTEPGS